MLIVYSQSQREWWVSIISCLPQSVIVVLLVTQSRWLWLRTKFETEKVLIVIDIRTRKEGPNHNRALSHPSATWQSESISSYFHWLKTAAPLVWERYSIALIARCLLCWRHEGRPIPSLHVKILKISVMPFIWHLARATSQELMKW